MSVEGINYDNMFIRLLNRLGDLLILSLLFVAGCIPIITIGASITATYYAAMKAIKGDDGYIFKNYVKSFRQNFKQATIIWIILAVLLFVFGVDLWFWLKQWQAIRSGISKPMIVISVALLVVTVLIATYVFPLQSKFDNKTSVQFRNAFLLSIKNFPITLLLMVFTLVIFGVFYFQTALAVAGFLLFGFGACAYVYAFFMSICFKPYLELDKVDTESDDEEEDDVVEQEESDEESEDEADEIEEDAESVKQEETEEQEEPGEPEESDEESVTTE